MKNNNEKKYFKSRGFYVTLAFGVIAVLGIGALGLGLNSMEQKNGLTDLNEPLAENKPDYDIAENLNSADDNLDMTENVENSKDFINPNLIPTEGQMSNQQITGIQHNPAIEEESDVELPIELTGDAEEYVLTEEDTVKEDTTKETNPPKEATKEDTTKETNPPKEAVKEDNTVAVLNQGSKTDGLSFNQDKGLLWPIAGNVIMKYSDDKGIYFQTLGQYKCNPAIMIQGEVDKQVLTASKCLITDISTNEETGMTVTTSVGSDYEIVYGQLKNVNAEVGDILEEGQVLGCLAEPTKYYVLEGSNLYFQVLENGKSINPMLLLR